MAAPELNRSHCIQIPFDPRQPWIWSVSFQDGFLLEGISPHSQILTDDLLADSSVAYFRMLPVPKVLPAAEFC